MDTETDITRLPEAYKEWPRITIVTPSYNQGPYIEETINSILNQNYPNLEYFIVDGGSTDETVGIIRKYESRIDWWVSEKDKGQTDAINKGFKRATGEIMNWINSDDILYPNALFHIARTFMENPDAGFVYGTTLRFNNEGPVEMMQHDDEDLPYRYFYYFPYSQQACFYKSSVLKKVDYLNESLQFSMDYDLFLRIILNSKVVKTDFLVGGFRDHSGSKTNNLEKVMIRENLGIFLKFLKLYGYNGGIEALESCGAPALPLRGYNNTDRSFTEHELAHMTASFLRRYIFYYHSCKDYKYTYHALKYLKKHDAKEYERRASYYDKLYRKSFVLRFLRKK